jgi:Zn-dependent peptidase ImmA (M78 family)
MAKKPLPIDPAIKRRAEEILTRSGCPRLANGIAVDIQKIIEEFCRFKFALVPNLELNGKARLAAFIPQHNYILVEEHCIEPRQRFSMAHELGHAQLEHDYGPADSLFASMGHEAFLCGEDDLGASENSELRVGRRRRSEIRANQFASFILMPEALVREVWRNRRDASYCASDLGVSAQAIGYRLQQLGLVSSGPVGR